MRKTIVVALLLAGCAMRGRHAEAQEPLPRPGRPYPIQEGFPADAILRLHNRTSALQMQLGRGAAAAAQSVIDKAQLWQVTEMPITVAFLGGSPELRTKIALTVQAWTVGTGVKFDFGAPGQFREWSRSDGTYRAQVRISFDETGYWSWVGAQSVDPGLAAPNQPSMNFEQFTAGLPSDWQGVVLHEFGHAIGFEHEHQNPSADCPAQFRWYDDAGYVKTTDMYGQYVQDSAGRRPGIYTVLGGPPNSWTQEQIDFNLRSLPATLDLRYSAFDRASVMMYSFADWMFVDGALSSCYTKENLTLSPVDLQAALDWYPPTPPGGSAPAHALGGLSLGELTAAQKLLTQKKLSPEVKAVLKDRLTALHQ